MLGRPFQLAENYALMHTMYCYKNNIRYYKQGTWKKYIILAITIGQKNIASVAAKEYTTFILQVGGESSS